MCLQILFSHHGSLTSEFVRTTLCPLDAIATKILADERGMWIPAEMPFAELYI